MDALRLLFEDKVCRYVVMNGGILTAKTSFAAAVVLEVMNRNPGAIIWWIAGLEFQLDAFWEEFAPKAREVGIICKLAPYKRAVHPNGCRLMAVTAGNEDRISSFHPKFIFGDEVAKWKPNTYNLVRLRLIKGATAFFFSTPRNAKHWVGILSRTRIRKDPKRTWEKVWRSASGRWALIECSTQEAGIANEEEIQELIAELPQALVNQELGGMIVEGGAGVFINVHALAVGRILKPKAPEKGKPLEQYRIGFDHAKTTDFGVLAVRKIRTNQVVKMMRFQNNEYHFQAEQAAELSERYNRAEIVYDATAAGGQMMGEMLDRHKYRDGKPVYTLPVVWDNVTKATMVEKMALRFEERRLILVDPKCGEPYETAVNELLIYERGRFTSKLKYTYGAPPGQHDDCPTAIILAFEGDEFEPRVRIPKKPEETPGSKRRGPVPGFIRQGLGTGLTRF